MRRTSARRGFTLTEILVAATLSLTFAALIAQTIATGVRVTTDTTSRVAAETRAREVFRTTTSALRGATPLGYCMEPAGVTYDNCRMVGTHPYPILYAGPDRIFFLAQRSTGSGSGAPDLVRMAFDLDPAAPRFGTFTVKRWQPLNADYTDSSWLQVWGASACPAECDQGLTGAKAPEQFRIGVIESAAQPTSDATGCTSGQRKIITYFDAAGSELVPSSGCRLSSAQLQNVALVVIQADVSYNRRGVGDRTFRLSAAVPVAAVNYAGVKS